MNKMKTIAAAVWLSPLQAALAHEGHGLPGMHWHATDTFGVLLAAGVAVLVYWLARGGK